MQKTDEPKKPAETDQTVAKFSVRFKFGFEFLKPKIFGLIFGGRFECTEPTKTEPNHNNIFYIKYIIFGPRASYTYLAYSIFFLNHLGLSFFFLYMIWAFLIFDRN